MTSARSAAVRASAALAEGVVFPEMVGVLHLQFARSVELGGPNADGWLGFRVEGWAVEEAAGRLAAMGAAVRVDGSDAVVARLAQLGAELSALYC